MAGSSPVTLSVTVDVTVDVTNEDEPGTVSLSASQPRIGIEIRANTPEDPDGGVTDVTWQWSKSDQANGTYTDIEDATMAGYTPVTDDDTEFLRVTASYTDAEGSGKTAVGMPADPNVAVEKVRNLAPVFNDDDDDTAGIQINPREVMEDAAAAADVGAPVVATDTADDETGDNNAILYLLSGADAASFGINSSTGQIMVGASAKLDHETNPAYEVTVTARDPEGLNSSVDVTIKVTDVDEPPEIMLGGLAISGPARVEYAEDRRDAVATYTASGPESANAMWSLEGADAGDFRISSDGMLTFARAPDFENPADGNEDNTYMVTVKSADGTYTDTHEVAVMVTDVDDMVTGDPLLAEYDPDGDGTIERADMRRAVGKFFADPQGITDADMRRLVGIYFSQ